MGDLIQIERRRRREDAQRDLAEACADSLMASIAGDGLKSALYLAAAAFYQAEIDHWAADVETKSKAMAMAFDVRFPLHRLCKVRA